MPPYRNYIYEYHAKITSGEIIAGKWIKKIYEIIINGLQKQEYFFNAKAANKAIRFIENFCHHSKGRNDLIKLELWQKAIVSVVFGIQDAEKIRIFREIFIVIGRKNGKSLFASAIIAYMAYLEPEYGQEIYCLAPKLDQAALVYDGFYQMVQAEDELAELAKKRRSDIYIAESNTVIKPIAFNAKKSDGFNPQLVVCDEMAAWSGDAGLKQYEVMKSALGARTQPMILSISTAGYINDSIYDELMKRSTSFLKGNSKERRLLPFLYMIDDVEKWNDIDELKKANIAWHCGASSYKHAECRNANSIGIEMCVRKKNTKSMGATDKDWYFEDATVEAAAELTRYLMDKYGVPASHVIRHYDVTGKICPNPYVYNTSAHTWEEFKRKISGQQAETPQGGNEKTIWNFLTGKGLNAYAVAGIMGNLYAESGLMPNNLQNTYNNKLGKTDAEYTAAVDNGSYGNFVKDSAGYGLAQWTYWSRKQALLNHAKQAGVSIADLNMQLGFLWEELQGYTAVMDALKKAGSVRAASDAVLTGYEKPADQSETVKKKRAEYGEGYYKKYAAGNGTKYYRVRKSWTDAASQLGAFTSLENAKSACKAGYTVYDDNGKAVYTTAGQQASAGVPFSVQVDILDLNIRTGAGTNYAKTGEKTGKGVFTIVEVKAGQGASAGWGRLKSGAGWISLDYVTRLA